MTEQLNWLTVVKLVSHYLIEIFDDEEFVCLFFRRRERTIFYIKKMTSIKV